MALDVEFPEPPDLSNRGMPGEFVWQDETPGSEDFYREDPEDLLQEGAWKEGLKRRQRRPGVETADGSSRPLVELKRRHWPTALYPLARSSRPLVGLKLDAAPVEVLQATRSSRTLLGLKPRVPDAAHEQPWFQPNPHGVEA